MSTLINNFDAIEEFLQVNLRNVVSMKNAADV